MKDFFKFTFASCLGFFLAFVVVGIVSSLIIGAVISSTASGMEGKKELKSNTVLQLDFSRAVPELTNNTQNTDFDFNHPDVLGLHTIIDLIENAKTDDQITAIFIDGDNIATGLSTSRLLRQALVDFKESGKPIVAHADNYAQTPYYLSSAADFVFLSPTGILDFRGFGSVLPFFKGTLDELGIGVNVFYAGDYKSATEPFRRKSMSDENREQTREFLNDLWNIFLNDISDQRNISVADLKAAANDLSTFNPNSVVDKNMVDMLGYRDDAIRKIKQLTEVEEDDKVHLVGLEDYHMSYSAKKTGDSDTRIAVVFAEGEIRDGSAQAGMITGDEYVDILRKLRNDEDVKAVVLRVNSPGGSVISSDAIWQEVERIQEAGKPVVVSMGDLAASGGYYISCGSDKIFSEPNTITGSIGVFMMTFNTRGFMEEKIKVNFDTVSTGKYSTRMNGIYSPNEEEAQALQDMVDQYYNVFLERVAEGRNMTVEQVHEVAQGRVWTGMKAKTLGLVDELGGLEDAIAEAANLADIENYRLYNYPRMKNPFEQLMEEFMSSDKSVQTAIDHKLENVIPYYDFYSNCLESKGPQARLPFILEY